ncbi:MAG TPA: hypothetical protein VKV20_13700 [Ktedonobacteraceae bacterium]|jgi:hypothetical protein|nr:hypothetical protein [Ktedonobacteraceae bacterium]
MAHIYSAPSLAFVIRHLMIYRLTGVLMVRRASSTHKEEASLAIVHGQAVRVRWGTYEDDANESILRWMNGWGEIHFIFYAKEAQRQLPPPRTPPPSNQNPQAGSQIPSSFSVTPPTPPIQASRPGNSMIRKPVREESRYTQTVLEDGIAYTVPSSDITKQPPAKAPGANDIAGVVPEKHIPFLTKQAGNYPITNLTRYDRTIFLLINDKRTVADLIQLTRRSLPEVYMSLQRLKDLQLIEI